LPPDTLSTRLSSAASPWKTIGLPLASTVTVADAAAGRASAATDAAMAPAARNGLREGAFMAVLLRSV
jgi:hypothetical protein